MTSLDADGFTMNYSVTVSAQYYVYYLALKGGSYKVGNETAKTSTTGTKSTTGVGFEPKGLFTLSWGNAASTSVAADIENCVGAATATNKFGCIELMGNDAADPSQIDTALDRTKILKLMESGASPSVNAEADLDSFDADGFTLNWSDVDATARQFVYLAIGDAASTNIKTINGLAKASAKTVNGLANASVKTINGLS